VAVARRADVIHWCVVIGRATVWNAADTLVLSTIATGTTRHHGPLQRTVIRYAISAVLFLGFTPQLSLHVYGRSWSPQLMFAFIYVSIPAICTTISMFVVRLRARMSTQGF
jgi:hypothetical protein